jgi:hypothetical protein
MKYFLFVFLSANVFAYIPTVESLFRNGDNAEVTSNTVFLNANLFKVSANQEQEESLFYLRWVYHFSQNEKLKMLQASYSGAGFSESNLVDKSYITHINPYLFNETTPAQVRGVFYSLLNSLLLNDGSFIVDFLKTKKVNVHQNQALVNRSQKNLLDRYRRYLSDKKRTEVVSPLEPTDPQERMRVRALLAEKLIQDQGQVKLTRFNSELVWHLDTTLLKAWISDSRREIRKIVYKMDSGDLEIYPKDYYLMDGVHKFPRSILMKLPSGDHYRLDFSELRYFSENENSFVDRVKKYDSILGGKKLTSKPEFLF